MALKAFRKKGHLTLRLVEAIAGKLTIEVGVSHTTKSTIYDLCGGQKVVKAKAHKVMTVTTTCAGSGIVIGGVDDQVRPVPAISIRKGDDVSIQLVSRNGTLSVTAHIA